MIRLHHLRIGRSLVHLSGSSRSSAPTTISTVYLRDENFRAPAALKEIHPLGKSPVIEDGDLILSESSAITTYLLEKFDKEKRFRATPDAAQRLGEVYPMAALPRRICFRASAY
jgi:glutathione S-transferase